MAFSQSRVLLVWTRLIMPDGKSIVLERQPGADTEGYAGLEDDVDYHWGSLLKGALLSTLLSVGAESGSSSQDDAISAPCAKAPPTASAKPASKSFSASSISSQP